MRRTGFAAPMPLLILFGAFLAAIVYLIAASLTRRSAPVYAPSAASRARAANWEQAGDTLTIDARDGDRWRYVSLAHGVVVSGVDTADADIAVQRYRVIAPVGGAIADLGEVSFDGTMTPRAEFVSTVGFGGTQPENAAIKHWYRYNLLTHLLEPNGHVYAVRARSGRTWKLAIVSYYCPGLEAGCLTIRYAPMTGTE